MFLYLTCHLRKTLSPFYEHHMLYEVADQQYYIFIANVTLCVCVCAGELDKSLMDDYLTV
jgi:hypothetical protein